MGVLCVFKVLKVEIKPLIFWKIFLLCIFRMRRWRRHIHHGWRPNRSSRSRINCWRGGRRWSRRRGSTSGAARSVTKPSDSEYCVQCVHIYITVCCLFKNTNTYYIYSPRLWYYPYKIIAFASVLQCEFF